MAGSRPRAADTSRVRNSRSLGSKQATRSSKGASALQVLMGREGGRGVQRSRNIRMETSWIGAARGRSSREKTTEHYLCLEKEPNLNGNSGDIWLDLCIATQPRGNAKNKGYTRHTPDPNKTIVNGDVKQGARLSSK